MVHRPLGAHVPEIKAALDKAIAEHIAVTQGRLSKANPVDTGRMASGWFIGKDKPNRSVPPDRGDAKDSVSIEPYNGRIEFDGTWYISNNLIYAERVCYDPIWAKGGAGGADWFTRISGSMAEDLGKRLQKYLPR